MSSRTQLGLSTSIVGLIIFGIIIGGYYINETRIQSQSNYQAITNFTEAWFDRVNKSNVIQNNTQSNLTSIAVQQNETIDTLVHLLQNRTPLFSNITENLVNLTITNEEGRQAAVSNLSEQHEVIIELLKHSNNNKIPPGQLKK
jgi:type IV secretory pathway ATPase VirB11/archaellum biosynthesis ATPase